MNDEQKQLLDKARQSFDASQYLLAGGYIDFAVARAYYTMFYLASAILAGENLHFSKHSAVISAFGKEFVKTGIIPAIFHQYLKTAQDLRHLGDYGNLSQVSQAEAETQIQNSKQFLDFAQAFLRSDNTE